MQRIPVYKHVSDNKLPARIEAHILTKDGAKVLSTYLSGRGEESELRALPSARDWAADTATHALLIRDVSVRLIRLLRAQGWDISEWQDDLALSALTQKHRTKLHGVVPDAFIVVDVNGTEVPLFIEIDRATETTWGQDEGEGRWAKKVLAYNDYLANRFPSDPYFEGLRRPIVLTLTSSARRAANLADATRENGGGGRYWHGVLRQLVPQLVTQQDLLMIRDDKKDKDELAAIRTVERTRRWQADDAAFWAPTWLTHRRAVDTTGQPLSDDEGRPVYVREQRSLLDFLRRAGGLTG